jgi:hypothetical protein
MLTNELMRSQSFIDSLVNSSAGSGVAPLVEQVHFDSNTNCLGRRRLVKAGSLMKLRSGRELGAFLFSDFILLTQVKGGGSSMCSDLNEPSMPMTNIIVSQFCWKTWPTLDP